MEKGSCFAQVKSWTFRREAGSAGIKKTGDLRTCLISLPSPPAFFPSSDDLPVQL